ncbi:MAG: hypothetical protein HWE30_17860 [Methylocystaceae bacterium]|nr:hypothetical protein [Methylocystaceae bacterium]
MSEGGSKTSLPKLLEVPIVSLDPTSLKARIWEKTGLDIGEGDPLHAAQVIYVAAMEDQARLLDLQAERMDKVFSDHLELFHTETETAVQSILDEINTQTVKERLAALVEQTNRADKLAKAIRVATRQFRIFTIVNVLSIAGALAIFFTVFS